MINRTPKRYIKVFLISFIVLFVASMIPKQTETSGSSVQVICEKENYLCTEEYSKTIDTRNETKGRGIPLIAAVNSSKRTVNGTVVTNTKTVTRWPELAVDAAFIALIAAIIAIILPHIRKKTAVTKAPSASVDKTQA